MNSPNAAPPLAGGTLGTGKDSFVIAEWHDPGGPPERPGGCSDGGMLCATAISPADASAPTAATARTAERARDREDDD